ncbi:MAG: hypothetical protein R3C04_02880 [Hyphomonas sp.]
MKTFLLSMAGALAAMFIFVFAIALFFTSLIVSGRRSEAEGSGRCRAEARPQLGIFGPGADIRARRLFRNAGLH